VRLNKYDQSIAANGQQTIELYYSSAAAGFGNLGLALQE